MTIINIILLVTSLTFILANLYRFNFIKFLNNKLVPTGFGLFIPVFLLFGIFFSDKLLISQPEAISVLIVMFFSLIYYIDDLFYLSASKRIILCILTSISITLVFYFYGLLSIINIPLFLILFLSIIIEIFLVNVLNFYDGADLNLSSIILISGIILYTSNLTSNRYISLVSLVFIGFSIGFSLLNFSPKSIYLGDTGSFSLSSIILLILMISFFKLSIVPHNLIIFLSFPAVDVLYVLIIVIGTLLFI